MKIQQRKRGSQILQCPTTLNMLAIETIINMRCNEKELLIFQNFQITNSVPIIVERSLLHTNITFDHFTHILNDPYIYS